MLVCAVSNIGEFMALPAVRAMLLLSGDVEENPGRINEELEQELVKALRCLPQIREAQDKLMKQLEKLETGQQELKEKLQTLDCKLERLEGDLPTASSSEDKTELSTQHSQLVDSMRNALLIQDDIENRSRRNNLLFFGLSDGGKETWDESEKKVIDLCAEKSRVTVSSSAIEHAHRIGKVGGEKPRPVILKFVFFKDKQRVISDASKLKGTDFSIGEGYSKIAHQQRQKLLEYGKQTDVKVTIKYSRGRMEAKIGSKSFVYDSASDSVKVCAQ
ncbi:hypothetical protein HPB48_011106 [Haemaphysalis longicornis]|uniref:Uncharacterized protein n=1 Tax=Haemaphysalis longicornis TaxID=44386 RepID=A0A9J6FWS6_HAELO|nr:hypothetical protein HPB48_011106 [Haemaphysalis longicornis]